MSEIIHLFGDLLADFTGKPKMACRGFIRIAMKDDNREQKILANKLNYSDMLYVFEHSLKRRLQNIIPEKAEEIVMKMKHALVENQAIFTLGN